TPNEAAQWKVGMRALARCRARCAPGEDRQGAVEQILRDQRLEVAALGAYTVLGHIDDAGVQLVAQQHADRLRRERLAASIREAPRPGPLQQFFLRVLACRVLHECASYERRPLRI